MFDWNPIAYPIRRAVNVGCRCGWTASAWNLHGSS